MIARMRRLIHPPLPESDNGATSNAKGLYTIGLLLLGITALYSIGLLIVAPQLHIQQLLTLPIYTLLIAMLALVRFGYVRSACWLLVNGLWFVLIFFAFTNGGVQSSAYRGMVVVVLCAGLLLGRRAATGYAIASMLLGLFLVYADSRGAVAPTPPHETTATVWLTSSVFFIAAAALLHLATTSITTALQQARHELEERRQIEQQLREREEQLQLALVSANMGAWAWHIPSGRVDWSEHIKPILGAAQQKFEGTYESFLNFVHPDQHALVEQAVRDALASPAGDYYVELHVTHPDGSEQWQEARGRVYRDEAGRPLRMTGVLADITRRKQTDEALRAREERLRSLVAAIPDLVLILDREGYYRDIFTGSEDMLAAPRERVIGSSIHDLLPPALARLAQAIIDRAVETREVQQFDYELRTQRGDCWFQARLVSYEDRDGTRILWLARDITQRKRAEEQLRQSEERYRAAISAADAVPYYLDYTLNRYTFMGEAIQTITGYSVDEITPQLMEEIDEGSFMRGRAAHLSVAEATRLARAGELLEWRCDTRIRTRSGEERWIADASIQVKNEQGDVVGAVGILQDITERVRLEEQLRQAQKLQAVGQLAGGLAHDFNNLLTIIISYSDMLLNTPSDYPLDEAYRDLRQIRAAGQRAAGLIRQLLAFSRRQVLDMQPLDLNSVVVGIVQMLERVIGEDIELRTALDPQLHVVRADAGQIEQVLMNLVMNARDAMPRGGTITITSANATLTHGSSHAHAELTPGSYAVLTVSDTGVGMDAEVQAHLFEPFFTTKEPGSGTGLGLATVHGIVKQCGGHIWFESEVGRGTTFEIYLPQLVDALAPHDADAAACGASSGKETILLVEDDPAVRRLVHTILTGRGYQVLEATSEVAERASAEFAGKIDLLLTDVIMPKVNGRELARHLTRARPSLKVLYMSGYADSIIARHGAPEPDIAFLPKPFTPDALAEKVRAVLDA